MYVLTPLLVSGEKSARSQIFRDYPRCEFDSAKFVLK
jgi:hypothetical protein